MQEKIKTIQVRQKPKPNLAKKEKNIARKHKMKANNMKLMLRVHYCKLNSMSMNNNKWYNEWLCDRLF